MRLQHYTPSTQYLSQSSPGETVEFVLLSVGVEEEAHPSSEVGRAVAGGTVEAGPACHSTLQHAVGNHCDLQDDQDDDSCNIIKSQRVLYKIQIIKITREVE